MPLSDVAAIAVGLARTDFALRGDGKVSFDGSSWVLPATVQGWDQAAYDAAIAPPIPDLTFAQLLIGLEAEGWITTEEAEAWLAGDALPAAFMTAVSQLPAGQQFAAKARGYRMQKAVRSDPLVALLATIEEKTSAEVDAFFLTYSQV